ncbi:MAG TPA: patatin-like phospholipase family protein [Planctomycetota bacterium]|nr:patatin-like phospholipase family protein [Planctomycetota bacterium]
MLGRHALAAALLPALAGCAHYTVNERLERFDPTRGYRFENLERGPKNTDSLLVCLAFSGGGTRAAALAFSVLDQLRKTEIVWEGEKKTLLDEVDVVSGVSGGSFPALYYGLRGPAFFTDLPERLLERDLQGEIEWKVVRNSWWLWADHHYRRSDLVQEIYDESIFDGATFAAMKSRPFVIVNATDLATGQRFEFTQEAFDLLGSDLGPFPVARAAAASAALPFAFSAITLRNHTQLEGPVPGFELPAAIHSALVGDDRRLHEWARLEARYVQGPDAPRYLHLCDGGTADNTGVRAIWTALRREDGFLRKLVLRGAVKKLIVLQVNAQIDPLTGVGDGEAPPSIVGVTEKSARISVNTQTFETLQLLREDAEIRSPLAQAKVSLHVIDVGFDAIPDPGRRAKLLSIPTELRIEPADLGLVLAAGKEALEASPDWKKLLVDLR